MHSKQPNSVSTIKHGRSRGLIIYDSHSSDVVGQIRHKQPMVAAIRDFPVGCRPQPTHVAIEPPHAAPKGAMENSGNGNESIVVVVGDDVGPGPKRAKLMGRPFSAGTEAIGKVDNHSCAYRLNESEKADPSKMQLAKGKSQEIAGGSGHFCQADFVAMKGEIALQSHSKSSSPNNVPHVSHGSSALVKNRHKSHPCVGFASTIRNLPLPCGSKASPLSREEAVKVVTPRNKALEVENRSLEAKSKESSPKTSQKGVEGEFEIGSGRSKNHGGVSKENRGKDKVVHKGNLYPRRDLRSYSGFVNQSSQVNVLQKPEYLLEKRLKHMGLENVAKRPEKKMHKSKSTSCAIMGEARSGCFLSPKTSQNLNKSKGEDAEGTSKYKDASPNNKAKKDMMQLVISDKKSSHGYDLKRSRSNNTDHKHRALNKKRIGSYHPSSSSLKVGNKKDGTRIREKVRETLRLFQVVFRKLLQEEEAKRKDGIKPCRRIDYKTWRILKEKGKHVNTHKAIGLVPGVEVGDEFQFKAELNVIGLHRAITGGIDYVTKDGTILATSIVSSGSYDDELDSDALIYTGQGGNVMHATKIPEDQKLVKGNLALANSMRFKSPVRVIRGVARSSSSCSSSDTRGKAFVYDGLYLVEEMWQETGPRKKLVFKFKLCRISGQSEFTQKGIQKSRSLEFQKGLMVHDISKGKEKFPISVINTIDYERPRSFTYITKMIYSDWHYLSSSKGCGCIINCSESRNCLCVKKNGGQIPYNYDGAIVEEKSVVYECGPHCNCPPSCYNRVCQGGIRFRLEIFKTKTKGWGVRSLDFIPSGSFICEYTGKLLEEKQAEKQIGQDEYLFDIGRNEDNRGSLWRGLHVVMPKMKNVSSPGLTNGEDGKRYTIDASKYGNIGRFINHSCSPNLFAQNVLYDHWDQRMTHIMLFAAENIRPLQELTYHYNCRIDGVCDADGNIKKKECFCGSSFCVGRIY